MKRVVRVDFVVDVSHTDVAAEHIVQNRLRLRSVDLPFTITSVEDLAPECINCHAPAIAGRSLQIVFSHERLPSEEVLWTGQLCADCAVSHDALLNYVRFALQ